jgi:hypothetical protein
MSHAADLLVILGILPALAVGFAVGWWARGMHRRPVI